MIRNVLKKKFSTLLVTEGRAGALNPGNLNALAAAIELNNPIDILALGNGISSDSFNGYGAELVENVFLANHEQFENPVADSFASAVQAFIASQDKYKHVITMSSTHSKDYIPRVAAQFNSQAIADITKIESQDTFARPAYAGNAIVTVKSTQPLNFITARTTNFEAFEEGGEANVQEIDAGELLGNLIENPAKFVSEELKESDRPDLAEAKIVVSGGRGLKNGENFALLEELADVLGDTAIGASRAAVDAGFCSNDMQVGQTGKIVAPELYFAVGISGAIQHLAGMKDSKVIVAINKDEEAPIFQIASYGIVGDLFDIVPELTEKLQSA